MQTHGGEPITFVFERDGETFERTLEASPWSGDYKQWLRERTHDELDDTYSSGVMHNDRTARPWHPDAAVRTPGSGPTRAFPGRS